MMMMKGSGRESGDGEIGRTPEQPARPRRSGAGLAGGGGFDKFLHIFSRSLNTTVVNIGVDSGIHALVVENTGFVLALNKSLFHDPGMKCIHPSDWCAA